VVVIRENPAPQLQERIGTILLTLTRRERVTLDSETLSVLLERRAQQTQLALWVERHYDVSDQV